MKNKRWANLFGTVFASATVGSVYLITKKMQKKYGQKPFKQKLIDTNLSSIVNSAVDTFLDTDNEKLEQITELFSK